MKAGAAAPDVGFPNTVYAPAFDSVKLNAGVVVAVATEVVNSGDKLPDEKLVTVPPPPPPEEDKVSVMPENVQVILVLQLI